MQKLRAPFVALAFATTLGLAACGNENSGDAPPPADMAPPPAPAPAE